jgi:hypothetical protein
MRRDLSGALGGASQFALYLLEFLPQFSVGAEELPVLVFVFHPCREWRLVYKPLPWLLLARGVF